MCTAFEVPWELANRVKTPMAMLMLVSSHRITRCKQLIPAVKRLMGKHSKAIWHSYFEIFNENSSRQRIAFFRDELI